MDELEYLLQQYTPATLDSFDSLGINIRETLTSTRKWDLRFLKMAKEVSEWSKDPSTQVGAVIVDRDRRPVSFGYNGFAKDVEDTPERLNDREIKYALTVHAEMNAMLFAEKSLAGCTLYTWPFMPCAKCAGPIIQSRIARIVAPVNDNPRWVDSFKLSKLQFAEAHIPLFLIPGFFE
jgi:dCMP deaminase